MPAKYNTNYYVATLIIKRLNICMTIWLDHTCRQTAISTSNPASRCWAVAWANPKENIINKREDEENCNKWFASGGYGVSLRSHNMNTVSRKIRIYGKFYMPTNTLLIFVAIVSVYAMVLTFFTRKHIQKTSKNGDIIN